MKFATWNVRSMSAGKQHVEQEMARAGIKVVGVSELWWIGQGRFTTDDGSMMVYSERESGKKHEKKKKKKKKTKKNLCFIDSDVARLLCF